MNISSLKLWRVWKNSRACMWLCLHCSVCECEDQPHNSPAYSCSAASERKHYSCACVRVPLPHSQPALATLTPHGHRSLCKQILILSLRLVSLVAVFAPAWVAGKVGAQPAQPARGSGARGAVPGPALGGRARRQPLPAAGWRGRVAARRGLRRRDSAAAQRRQPHGEDSFTLTWRAPCLAETLGGRA